MSSGAAPTCPTCGGPVRIVALANGDLDRETVVPRVGRYRCKACGKTHPSKRSRAQHQRFCKGATLAATAPPASPATERRQLAPGRRVVADLDGHMVG